MPYAKGTLADQGLPGAARLLHALCFDRVALEPSELDHEPRWSCQCKDCGSVWIASKSGDVMRIDLKTHPPTSRSIRGKREARTIYHLHHGAALGGGSFLLIGRDDGALDIVPDPPRATSEPPPPGFYLASWWASPEERHRPRHVNAGFGRAKRDPMGITAISVLQWGPLDTFDILVATREPALYILEAADHQLWIRGRRIMPGWIQWILGPPDDDRITCISRGGDIVRFAREDLLAEREPAAVSVPLLPTAAMPFDGGSVLLGTTKGLFVVRDGKAEVALPVTREPVLCLDRAEVSTAGSSGNGEIRHDYITMGLENGRLRIVDAERLLAFADAAERPAGHDHNFTVEVGDAVLAVETLQADGQQRHTAYVLTVLRDHSIRLFQVTSQEAQRAVVEQLWSEWIEPKLPEHASAGAAFAIECDEIRTSLRGSDAAWRYMLVDVVLPRLCTRVPDGGYRAIAALACEIADGDPRPGAVADSDRLVLHRLSTRLEELTGDSVDLQLQVSRSILRAVPRGDDERWEGFVESHLRDLHAAARKKRQDEDRYRLVGWARFVRKFVLLGHTFAAKRFGLGKLVTQNYEIRKYLDAVIYQTRLLQRRHDLEWESRFEPGGELAEVAALHHVACGGDHGLVVVVTVDGKIALVDAGTGQQLELHGVHASLSARHDSHVLAPVRGDASARTLACAVVRLHGDRAGDVPGDTEFRVVLSCSGSDPPRPTREPPPDDPPPARLAVFDFRWTAAEPLAATLVRSATRVACDGERPQVHAVEPLPSWSDAFAVGLESSSAPVGLLEYDDTTREWKLELASDEYVHADGHVAPRSERLPPAPGRSPTRALAVVFDKPRSRCLLVAGSDDGLVRAISFAVRERPQHWRIEPWDRLPDAVSSIALGRTGDTPYGRFACYLGTTAGDTFALAILDRQSGDTRATVLPFGDYDAHALWRDTHDGPVLSVRLWTTELYDGMPEVLAVVTENGRVCIYNHAHRSRPGPVPGDRGSETDRQSAAYNYYFRGLRLDRVTLPGRLRAWTQISGDRFVAAGPHALYMGELAYLRNSKGRSIPDWRRTSQLPAHLSAAEPAAAVEPDDDGPAPQQPLEGDIWARIRRLLEYSRSDEPFKIERTSRAERLVLKLDLCDLVRLEGGALSAYVLRARWPPGRWHRLTDQGLVDTASALLGGLDPENREDAERIKIVIRSMCRAFLFHDLDELRNEILGGGDCMAELHGKTAVVCKIAADYLRFRLAPSTNAAGRLRIVVIKELLRVPILRRMAVGDEHSATILQAVESALASCLQDEDRLVRIEAMRALSIVLRNAGVMAGRAEGERATIIAALFPHQLRSVEWILRLTVGGLLRFPSFTQRTAMVSGAWHMIWALLPLFQLFRGHALALCDYLVRKGLDVEVLAMCARSLRGQAMPPIRGRIVHLYLLPKVQSPDDYVLTYDQSSIAYREMLETMALPTEPNAGGEWYELGDRVMADRLLLQLDRLARMWRVADRKQMQDSLPKFRAGRTRGEAPPGDAPLADLEHMVDDLAAVAERLAHAQKDEAGELDRVLARYGPRTGPPGDGDPTLTTPIRAIVAGIVGQWRKLYKPAVKAGSMLGGRYELGCPSDSLDDHHRSVFTLNKPENLKQRYLIKVFESSYGKDAVQRFLDGAWVNHELSKRRSSGILEVKLVLDEPPAYVIREYSSTLEKYLTGSFVGRAGAINDYHGIWCIVSVAAQIADALHTIHTAGAGRYYHGDVKPASVLIRFNGDEPSFYLGDFYRAYRPGPAGHAAGPLSSVPDCLLNRSGPSVLQWGDVVGLSLILYRMLTGDGLDPATPTLDPPVQRLRELAGDRSLADRPEIQRIIETVGRVFEGNPMTIQQFRESVRLPVRRAVPVTRGALLDQLVRLPSTQFDLVVFRANVSLEILPGSSAPQQTRAIELIRYFEQRNELDRLAQIVDGVVDGVVGGS